MCKKDAVAGLVIQSIREMKSGGTRAGFLPHYWFGVLVRMAQLRKQMADLVSNMTLWQYRQEVSYGDAQLIIEKLLSGDLVERIPSVIISSA